MRPARMARRLLPGRPPGRRAPTGQGRRASPGRRLPRRRGQLRRWRDAERAALLLELRVRDPPRDVQAGRGRGRGNCRRKRVKGEAMAGKKNGGKPARPKQTPLDVLIEKSVEAALTTWLSGTAMKIGEGFVREVFADEAEQAQFRDQVREASRSFLERLKS